jgi:hypothetical protein
MSGRYPFENLPRRCVRIEDAEELLATMAGEGEAFARLRCLGVVLQIAGRAHGGNFFHRAGMSAQLLAQACHGWRVE